MSSGIHAGSRRPMRRLSLAAPLLALTVSVAAPAAADPPTLPSRAPDDGDSLGINVAMSPAYTVVAAPREEVEGHAGAGAVHVFSAGGDFLFTLSNPKPEADARFGAGLAVSDDLFVVGASHADGSGAVYLFNAAGQQLGNPITNPGGYPYFGREVALTPQGEILVAAIGGTGAVYRFDTSGVQVGEPILNPDPGNYLFFGTSLAAGDGGRVFATGLRFWGGGGVVYRFAADGTREQTLPFPDAVGLAVAAGGGGSVFVGETRNDLAGVSGTAYHIDANGFLLSHFHSPADGIALASRLAPVGDQLLVGAPVATAGAPMDAGEAHLFLP